MSVEAIGALSEPQRRAVYEHVAAAAGPVSRNDVADALGIGRNLAAHHLDKLVDAGLLAVSTARLNGRTGPGAGRPSKLYRRSEIAVEVSFPPRGYGRLAALLADAVERAGADLALYDVAREHGRAVPMAGETREETLHRLGYEPFADGDLVRLRNCPFDGVSRSHPSLVCGANLALLEGAFGPGARIAPGPDGCCVVFDRAMGRTPNQ